MSTQEDVALGAAMKAAAKEARLTAKEISQQMGVGWSTIHRWWRGQRAPRGKLLADYARVVGVSVEELTGQSQSLLEERLVSMWVDVADALMVGKSIPAAIERALGRRITLGEEERQSLAARSETVRQGLQQTAGTEWDLLSEDQKREVAERVRALAEERRLLRSE